MVRKGLRTAPFNDQMLREMAISFPRSKLRILFVTSKLTAPALDEMCQIPGIDKEKVIQHGPRFLQMIQEAEKHYLAVTGKGSPDRPNDPNKHTSYVHVISSDDEGERRRGGSGDDLSDRGHHYSSSPGERSGYFAGPSTAVRQFNAKLSQIQTMAPPPPQSRSKDKPRGQGSYRGKKGSRKGSGSGSWKKKTHAGGAGSRGGASTSRGRPGGMGMMPT